MKALSGLGLGLSLVFGCLLLALIAEVYYLLRWKKKKNKRVTCSEVEDEDSNYAKELVQLFCFKKSAPLQPHNANRTENQERNLDGNSHEQEDLELGSGKNLILKAIGEGGGASLVESELMRLHNYRFLFTIKEETKEDLESDDGKSKGDRSRKGSRGRSLSDLILNVNDTPTFLTPLASPRLKSSPLNPDLDSYHHHGFNPLFESSAELEFNRSKSFSPPPKFKFLRDAEEKLQRKLKEDADRNGHKSPCSEGSLRTETLEGSFLKFMNAGGNRERETPQKFPESTIPSSSSQVLPLASSPTTITLEQKPAVNH